MRGGPGRPTVRLIDPEETNRDDPAVWIDLPVIERMTLVRHPGAQEIVTTFQPSAADPVAEERETARRVALRRVTHAESNVDAQLDDSSYLADDRDYVRKAATIDETQHLDVEVIESYPSTYHPGAQGITVTLNNESIKDLFSAPPNDAKRNPVRLDPHQNILNVSWGGGATEFEPGAMVRQESAIVANTKQITISMWVYIDSDNPPTATGDFYTLMNFGGF